MRDQRPAALGLTHRLHVVLLVVVAVALTACGGGGGGASPGLAPTTSPPPVNPPSQFATGGKSFTAVSDRSLALPLYGISIPFAAVVPAGSVFAGRRLETDGSISVTFESAAGAERSVRFAATGVLPFIGTSSDVDYLEFGALGSVPTLLDFARFGTLSFTSPTQQVVAFYGGFETPTGSGPTAGTLSYQGGAIAVESVGGGVFNALAGSIHLEADFQSNTIYGAINNLKQFDSNGTLQGDYDYRFILSGVSITNTSGSRTFSGSLIAQDVTSAAVAPTSGSAVNGRFFGNTAQEAAGVWQTSITGIGVDIWGSFGATTATLSGVPTFLQSINVPLSLHSQAMVEVNRTTGVPTTIDTSVLPTPSLTPLATGGIAFSNAALGTFNPPGSSTAPHLDTTGVFFTGGTNPVAVSGASGASPPSIAFLAERGTLSYARFGYWIDTSLASTNDVFVYNYFGTGVQTPISSMPTSGTAHYAGTTMGKMVDSTNTTFDFFGTAHLQADFGTRSISGSVNNLTGSTAPPITSIGLNAGTIPLNSNSFSGTASAAGGLSGSWSGKFYGPAANEVAGTYTLTGGAVQAWGSFGAGR